MERLTSYKSECKREMICKYEDCMVDGEHCPHLNEDCCFCLQNVLERLAEYEDLEEQGLLLKLPCKVGDTIYVIPSKANYGINIVNRHKENNRVYEQVVNRIEMCKSGYLLSTCDGMACVIEEFYKKTWFLTREEAETALKELEAAFKSLEAAFKSLEGW